MHTVSNECNESMPGYSVKVCVFCEEWGSGGIETYLLNMLAHVDRKRFEISIITSRLKSEVFLPRLNALNIRFIVLSAKGANKHLHLRAFQQVIKEQMFDVIYFNLYEGLALCYAWLAKKDGVSIRIVHSHNNDLRKSPTRMLKLAVHYVCKQLFGSSATCRLACSEAAAKFLFRQKDIVARNWQMIPNGIELERFRFDKEIRDISRRKLGLNNEIVVGCIGRLCYQKNQTFLLQAFRIIHEKHNDAKLFIVGEGEDLDLLKQQTTELELDKVVTFFGTTNEIPKLLCAFDILAIPSVFESLGIVAIEAQAAGLPVLCSDRVPKEVDLTDIVEHLPLDDASLWATKLMDNAGTRKEDTYGILRQAGYSIQEVAMRIQSMWFGIVNMQQ